MTAMAGTHKHTHTHTNIHTRNPSKTHLSSNVNTDLFEMAWSSTSSGSAPTAAAPVKWLVLVVALVPPSTTYGWLATRKRSWFFLSLRIHTKTIMMRMRRRTPPPATPAMMGRLRPLLLLLSLLLPVLVLFCTISGAVRLRENNK